MSHFYWLIVLCVLAAAAGAGLLYLAAVSLFPASDLTLTIWRRNAPR